MSKRLKKLKKSGPYTATITGLSHEGRGVCHIDGKTTFISGALPGETVRFNYKMCRNSFDEGDICEVIDASPDRVEAQCPNFGVCGGCQLQHMEHSKQLQHKKNTLAELLSQHADTKVENWLETLQSSPWGYRRKARLSVKQVDGKGDLLIGFREKRSRYVTDMRQCEVLIPEVGQQLDTLRQHFSRMEAKASIAQIEVCATDAEVALIVRHLTPLSDDDQQLLIALCIQLNYKLYLQPAGIDSVHPVYPENSELLMSYTLPEFDLRFNFNPSGFIQVNSDINRQMVKQAINLLELNNRDHVLDLFCGIGNFSLAAAKTANQVTGVEGDQQAVELACANAQLNQITNADFHTDNLFEPNTESAWAKQQYDKILLDPPRSGCKEVIPLMKLWKPKRIVYISCNPITFARDVGLLKTYGYSLRKVGIMDMFAHTEHAEVMGLLTTEK